MHLLRKNNTDEIERLFKEHHSLLCLVSFGILKDGEAAKDIVQDFFISYWQRKKSISITTSFKSYAIRAVKNLSLLSLEKKRKEESILQGLGKSDYEETNTLSSANERSSIQVLLNKLPESRRQIFISAILNGQSYAEIAENQGISINTVKTQMKRAYAFLRSEATENLIRLFFWSIFILMN